MAPKTTMTVGGTVRGITRLFGGVPRKRDTGQRLYEHIPPQLSTPNADTQSIARRHPLDLSQCAYISFDMI
jgi:hypothetical protein